MTENAIAIATDSLYPLNFFYQTAKAPLPRYEVIAAEDVPQPYKKLLVHNGDMTSVLQNFHRKTVHVEAIDFIHRGDKVQRQVRLCGEDATPVEYGAIEINLAAFEEAAQKDILDSYLPLGAILHKFKIDYLSRPRAFFKMQSDAHINAILGLSVSRILFGRVNILKNSDQEILARVVEILPPI